MLKLTVPLAVTLMFLTVPGLATTTAAQATHETRTLRIRDGRLFVNEKMEYSGFSMYLAPFSYLFIYIPQRGLITVSDAPFEGAIGDGASKGKTLSFHAGDAEVSVKSSDTILDACTTPIWVRLDPEYKLDVKSVVLGYGDEVTAPAKWPASLKEKL